MIVIGVDPGTQITGWAVICLDEDRKPKLIDYGHVKNKASLSKTEKMLNIHLTLSEKIKIHIPNVLSLEKSYVSKNFASSLVLENLRGAIMLSASLNNINVVEYDSCFIKQAITGYGHADKVQVMMMVRKMLNITNDMLADESDAMAIAICGAKMNAMRQIINNNR